MCTGPAILSTSSLTVLVLAHWFLNLSISASPGGLGKLSLLGPTLAVQWLNPVSLCGLMGYSTPGLPVFHQLPESAQTHDHWVSDAIQPSHLLMESARHGTWRKPTKAPSPCLSHASFSFPLFSTLYSFPGQVLWTRHKLSKPLPSCIPGLVISSEQSS